MEGNQVLLVDDDSLVLQALSMDLEERGYEVKTAQTGEAAAVLVDDNDFDVVVTDLVMDGMNGNELLKHVKDRDPYTVVIIMTGYGTLSSAIEAVRLSADDYLLKPCDPEEIYFRMESSREKLGYRKKIMLYEGFLPICSVCSKVRDDHGRVGPPGQWLSLDAYFKKDGKVAFTHSYCPDCVTRIKKDLS